MPRHLRDSMLRHVESVMYDAFGGLTETQGVGLYRNRDGQDVIESVTVVSSFAQDALVKRKFGELSALARRVAKTLDQETVLFSVKPADVVVFVGAE